MGMAIDAIGFLLVLGSIPLAFGILRLVSKDESIEFVSFIGERSTLYAFVGLVLLLVCTLWCVRCSANRRGSLICKSCRASGLD